MSADESFVAEIIIVPFSFAPKGFALCNGQLLPISYNTALFSLLGTNYGGDGKTTFALPNMQGMVPLGAGDGIGLTPRYLGESGGADTVTLTVNEMPSHSHIIKTRTLALPVGTANNTSNPVGNYPGVAATTPLYAATAGSGTAPVKSSLQALPVNSPGDPINNMQPYLTVNFAIAMQGIFPPRT
jgi:microcystin-dependent protein